MTEEKLLKLIYLQLTMLNAGVAGLIGYLRSKAVNALARKHLTNALKDIEDIGKAIMEMKEE